MTDPLAEAAVAEIQSGMIVGLGTGRTASRGIRALASRVREEKLDIRCVSTSEASERLAKELGLNVIEFCNVEAVDYLFDGADEIDRNLRMLKGSGGAMTRERIVAWASDRRVYMVQEHKVVTKLGTSATIPIAVLAFGLSYIRSELRQLGLNGVCRRNLDGSFFITDNGNLVLDVSPNGAEPEQINDWLNDIPGVIDHGLFLTEADEILIETPQSIERLVRPT